MNSDSLGTSATSEHVAPENNTPTNNYRRWMTDMAADIAHLKLSINWLFLARTTRASMRVETIMSVKTGRFANITISPRN